MKHMREDEMDMELLDGLDGYLSNMQGAGMREDSDPTQDPVAEQSEVMDATMTPTEEFVDMDQGHKPMGDQAKSVQMMDMESTAGQGQDGGMIGSGGVGPEKIGSTEHTLSDEDIDEMMRMCGGGM